MWLATLPIGLVGMRQDAFDVVALLGMTWFQLVFLAFASASVLVVVQLMWVNWHLTHSGSTFDVELVSLNARQLFGIKVKNTSKNRANLTARAEAIVPDLGGKYLTESFLLTWEEVNSKDIDLNPDDHAISELLQWREHQWDEKTTIHLFDFFSSRYGQRHTFPSPGHAPSSPPVSLEIRISLYSHPTISSGQKEWHFRLHEKHEGYIAFEIEELQP